MHAQTVCKDFKIKNLGRYHDLYICISLLLADVLKNLRNMRIEIYGLDPVHLFAVPESAWQAALKKSKVKLDLLTDIDMLLMVEKGVREGKSHIFVDIQKLITNASKIIKKILIC